jgi:hypothetical protein
MEKYNQEPINLADSSKEVYGLERAYFANDDDEGGGGGGGGGA